MKPYNEQNRCKKCGGSAKTNYEKKKNLLIRTCSRCGNEWEEAPLDKTLAESRVGTLARLLKEEKIEKVAPKEKEPRTKEVLYMSWSESERGWGQRPDGYSFHLTEGDRVSFVEEYWKGMPEGPAPDEYSRPDDNPRRIKVTEKVYKKIKRSKFGLRTDTKPEAFAGGECD